LKNTFQKKNGITINFVVSVGMPYSRSLLNSNSYYVLTETNLDLVAFAKFIQAKSIHPYFHLLTEENTARMQEGLQVFPWTVNEIEDIKK
jgi:hypothetical protein